MAEPTIRRIPRNRKAEALASASENFVAEMTQICSDGADRLEELRAEMEAAERQRDRLLAEVKRHEKWWGDAHMYDGPQDLSQRHQAKDKLLYKAAQEIEEEKETKQ